MAKVMVEKYVGSKRETTFSLPTSFLSMASALLPRAALNALAEKGINVPEMLLAKKQEVPYTASVNLVEKGISKTIVVSVF